MFDDPGYTDQETIEFVISFLEIDPRFFRSGYIKEEMLRKIGRAELNSKQTRRLRAVLLDAVERRGGREFRRYCRTASHVYNDELLAELRSLPAEQDSSASRAKMMLRYIEQAESEG